MDDLVAMLRELNPLLGHGGGKTVNEAADAIERQASEMAAMALDLKCLRARNAELEARVRELESGQPCEVNGVAGQWVPKYCGQELLIPALVALGSVGNHGITGRELAIAYDVILTASAQEMLTEQERKV